MGSRRCPTVGSVSPRPLPLARLLGRRIVALREELGLTQERLAWEAGLSSKGYLSRIERGERLPSLVVTEKIAHRLAVEVRDLFIFPDRGDVDAAMERIRRRVPK
jgi:transcriptional regulator with XRE-family HTH domain